MPRFPCLTRLWLCLCFLLVTYSLCAAGDVYLLSDDGSTRLHAFEEEQAAVLSSLGGTITALAAENTFSRSSYDDDMRLVSKVTWKQDSGTNIPVVSKISSYTYNGSSGFPASSSEQDLLAKTVTTKDFTATGKIKGEKCYSISDEAGEQLLFHAVYSYDGESKLTEKVIRKYSDAGIVSTERTVLHVPGEERGGYDYYIDDSLVRTLSYSAESDYTDTLYFPGGQRIVAVYSDGRLAEEIFYAAGKEIRRNTY